MAPSHFLIRQLSLLHLFKIQRNYFIQTAGKNTEIATVQFILRKNFQACLLDRQI